MSLKRVFKCNEGGTGLTYALTLVHFASVKEMEKYRLLDVSVLCGAAGYISNHYLVRAKSKLRGGWKKIFESVKSVEVTKIKKLEKEEYSTEYETFFAENLEIMKGGEINNKRS